MNVVILMGRMVRDPELKYTSGGKAFANFTLAVQKTKDEAEFVFDFDADFSPYRINDTINLLN